MTLCYRSINYQNASFALYLPKNQVSAKFRGVNYSIASPIKMQVIPTSNLTYRGISYTKQVFSIVPDLAFCNN